MSTAQVTVLAERCAAMRGQLRANRLLIASRFAAADAVKNSYPRSVTMRLLQGRFALNAPLLVEAAIVVSGSPSARLLLGKVLARVIDKFTARST